MLITPRDALIIHTIADFKMLPARAIREIVFPHQLSNTSCDRALLRLVQRKYITRVERRMIGGNGAGSGQYIYKLGVLGRKLVPSTGVAARMIDLHHTLEIADTYLKLKRYESGGDIKVLSYYTEPASWVEIGGVELRPDLHAEVALLRRKEQMSLFIEVDLGTEHKQKVIDKIESYLSAWLQSAGGHYPYVVFLVPDDARVKELRGYVSKVQPVEAQDIFIVAKSEDFPHFLFL